MKPTKNPNYSYWELEQYFKNYDLIIVGSGIVGLSTAISFKKKNLKASVLILERGVLPSGASTKNAGFACFGSSSELLADLSSMKEETVWQTVSLRWKGLSLLRKRLGDKNIDFKNYGGYELFDKQEDFDRIGEKTEWLNKKIKNTLGLSNTFSNSLKTVKKFKGVKGVLINKYEGQINTGGMMSSLIKLAQMEGVTILNSVSVNEIVDKKSGVTVLTDAGEFRASKLAVCTNGFASRLLKIKDVRPARAQVLITKPIENLGLRGTFHYQEGYYYFRNIHNRILFGGGRNTDMITETTDEFGINKGIHTKLERLLKHMILPGVRYEIDHRWSGIMGVGSEKKPIVKFVSTNILAAVRMGGMGVAIGSMVGELAADKLTEA
jgi:gamma-glutamylputrescine oxidase